MRWLALLARADEEGELRRNAPRTPNRAARTCDTVIVIFDDFNQSRDHPVSLVVRVRIDPHESAHSNAKDSLSCMSFQNGSSWSVPETKVVTARAAELRDQGADVITLSQGEPDFDTPSVKLAPGPSATGRRDTRRSPKSSHCGQRSARASVAIMVSIAVLTRSRWAAAPSRSFQRTIR